MPEARSTGLRTTLPATNETGATRAGTPTSRTVPSFLRPILRLPLYYKLLIANALIVLAASVGCALALASGGDFSVVLWRALLPAGLAVVVSVIMNAVVVRVALGPLSHLAAVARQVQQGDHDARARVSVIADRDLEHLVETFNAMLDSVSVSRVRLRELAARALDAGEAERKRISQELHDGVAQTLAALLVQLRLARDIEDGDVRKELLAETAEQLADSVEELRVIARGLRPPALDMLGLVAAVETHARIITGATGLRVEVNGARINGLLSAEAELALYRLLQEALSNVVKHAHAEHATVRIEPGVGSVVATVTDNGSGFLLEDALARRGLGLFGMHERASYAGGRVHIDSKPGRGTTVRIEFPVRETANYV
jgi:two-component system, NarL family, sensor histidine kinase UhpB